METSGLAPIQGKSIAERLAQLRAQLAGAARAAGREAGSVRLLAVSKKVDVAAVVEAAAAGQAEFAENYVQDGLAKICAIEDGGLIAPQLRPRWHMIGKLQSNKAAKAARIFDVLHGLDSMSAARAISRAMEAAGRRAELMLQIKLGGGEQRAGVPPAEAAPFLEAACRLPGLSFIGVMGVAPQQGDPRPHFARLRELSEKLRVMDLPNAPLQEISAGMSGDFVEAVAEGATMVRIGSAIFGPRQRDGV